MKQQLLSALPPYRDEWVTIVEDQTVKDIVNEVLEAHELNASHYDLIALYFDGDTVEDICSNIFTFCKKELHYKEESEKDQTTMVPAGILIHGAEHRGIDCKHYSSFTGGVLDALNRTGKKIKWCYRFASYRLLNKAPHHVFVVVNPGANEIWIDPTPNADKLFPCWQIDYKVFNKKMAINRNIGTTASDSMIGGRIIFRNPQLTRNPLGNTYPDIFGNFLGLNNYKQDYAPPLSVHITTDEAVSEMNHLINQGPHPGFSVTKETINWIWDAGVRSFNFFYPYGVYPGFSKSANVFLPSSAAKPVVTSDFRLTFDKLIGFQSWDDPLLHITVAYVQDLVNEYDEQPYFIKPKHIVEAMNGDYGNVDKINLFNMPRGKNFFDAIGKVIGDVVQFVKNGVLKIVGSIPRNAFLSLVGLNAFKFATNLKNKIEDGKWADIAKRWKNLGGNPDKLLNTINSGAGKSPVIEDSTNSIGEPVTITAFMAAAAPIIAAMLAFLDKDGKVAEVLNAAKHSLAKIYPDIDFSGFEFLDKNTGEAITWSVDDIDNENLGGGNDELPGGNPLVSFTKNNPLIISAGAAALTYFIMNKKESKKNYTMPLIIGGSIYLLLTKLIGGNSPGLDKRAWLIDYINKTGEQAAIKKLIPLFKQLSLDEIDVVFDWIYNYVSKDKALPKEGVLYQKLFLLNEKYGLFGS